MKNILLIFCSIVTYSLTFAQDVSLTKKEIASLKKLIDNDSTVKLFYTALKKTADAALEQSPNPIDTVISEGHLATDPNKIKTQASLKDINKVYALAIVYNIEDEPAYLNKLVEYFTSWATINKPQGNPINDTKFEDLFFAYDLTRSKFSTSGKDLVDSWLTRMADEEIRTGSNKTKGTSKNNWNSHRLKVIGCIAYLLDKDVYKKHIDVELPLQIENNLLPDGSGIDFHERDALHYHVYTLEPLIALATVLERATGKDYYNYNSPSGASIKKSIDFLVPYVAGEKTHAEFVNSKVAFDKKRADNKEPGYETGAKFVPTKGNAVLTQAAYFEPGLMDVVRNSGRNTKKFPNWQAVINELRR